MRKIIILVTLLFSLTTLAFAAEDQFEYKEGDSSLLLTVYMNGRKLGNYPADEKNGEYYLSPTFFERLRLPITEKKPLSFLEKYGVYQFNEATQTLNFIPNKPEYFKELEASKLKNPVQTIQQKSYDLKAVDYQASTSMSNAGKTQFGFFGSAIGRVLGLDLDTTFSSFDNKVSGLLQWHKEENRYVKDIQVGTIPLYGLERGFSIGNEPANRYSNGFGEQPIFVNYPLGTRIDVYRAGVLLKSQVVDAPQYRIELDLIYGNNEYLLRAFMPDGNVKEEIIRKDIEAFMLTKGNTEYSVAGGVDINNDFRGKTRVSYGLTQYATLFTDLNFSKAADEKKAIGAYLRVNEDLLFVPKVFTDGYGSELYYKHNWLNFSGNWIDRDNYKERRGIIGISTFLQPVISVSELEQNNHRVLTSTLRTAMSYRMFHLSPFVEYKKDNNIITRTVGGTANYMLPYMFRLSADIRLQDEHTQRLEASIVKSMPIGEARLFTIFGKQAEGKFEAKNVGAELRLYNWQYASLSLAYTHGFTDNSNSATFSISGSLTRAGACKTAQKSYGTAEIRTFLSTTKQPYEATIYLNGQKYTTTGGKVIIPDLIPYATYIVTTEAEMEAPAEPQHPEYSFTPARGELATIEIPFIPMTDIEGNIPSGRDDVTVNLLDNAGKVVKTQKTFTDGYYAFHVRADKTYTVDFGNDSKPVQKKETPVKPAPKAEPAKPAVQKHVEPAKLPEPVKHIEPVKAQEPEFEGYIEVVYPEPVEVKAIKTGKIAHIRVAGKPNLQDVKDAAWKIKEQGNDMMVIIWAYDKTTKKAFKLAKQIERMIEKEGVYVNSIEGFIAQKRSGDVLVRPF